MAEESFQIGVLLSNLRSEALAGEEMDMEMRDEFTAMLAFVDDQSVALIGRADLVSHLVSYLQGAAQ